MHEVSIIEQTLELAVKYAQEQQARQIHCLKMRIGKMSGVVPEALNFAFSVVTQGTIAADATLEIETVAVVCYCHCCQAEFSPDDLFYQCPTCGQFSTDVRSGQEIELASLEIS
jgi:hydrogenase nickel incorporation protein HypA/HybF